MDGIGENRSESAQENRRFLHLIETADLATTLASHDPTLRVVDMRGYVRTQTQEDGAQTAVYTGAAEEYAVAHLPGAVYLDWTRDIVDLDAPVAAQVDAVEVHRGRDDEQPGQRPDGRPLGHDHVVDDLPLHQRDRRGRDGRRERARERDYHRPAIMPAVTRQPPQPPVLRSPRPSRVHCPP